MLTPDMEKELRKLCSTEMRTALAEIDYLRDSFLDMGLVMKRLEKERDQLRKRLVMADSSMEQVFNYLHWNADNLSGDDLIGDGRLTKRYEEILNGVLDALSKIRGRAISMSGGQPRNGNWVDLHFNQLKRIIDITDLMTEAISKIRGEA